MPCSLAQFRYDQSYMQVRTTARQHYSQAAWQPWSKACVSLTTRLLVWHTARLVKVYSSDKAFFDIPQIKF